jgi:hypothetical protein
MLRCQNVFILHLLYSMHSFGFSCKYFVTRHHQHLRMTKSIVYSLLSLTTISKKNAFHYCFTCPNYTEIRLIMMNNLNWVQTSDLNLLTCGSDDLTYEENINIIKHVFNFIKFSKRFLVV